MTDEYAASASRRPLDRPQDLVQFGRFVVVGASGYALNIITFALLLNGAGVHYRVAATGAFAVALSNNFFWHRHWTFAANEGAAGAQLARFVVVCLTAFAFDIAALSLLIDLVGAPKVLAQAITIAAAAPLTFAANKFWAFRR